VITKQLLKCPYCGAKEGQPHNLEKSFVHKNSRPLGEFVKPKMLKEHE